MEQHPCICHQRLWGFCQSSERRVGRVTKIPKVQQSTQCTVCIGCIYFSTSLLDAVQSLTKDKEELSSHLRNHGITEEDVVLDYSEAEDKDNAYYPRFPMSLFFFVKPLTQEKNKKMNSRFALFFHHATESLVLAVRGTSSIKDAISDLMADEVSLLDSKC